jgi:anti-anti-sigma regulatory factor
MSSKQITLPSDLDLAAAAELKRALVDALALGQGLAIDASDVQRALSPCLQLLVAAVKGGATITTPSAAFAVTAKLLDLTAPLGLTGNANA